ncbi:MAG: NAD(P)H-binding protein [Verrucomicrobia bacterium]|nr:NAD(P)H-binding protein [Verrucomicrobiota bacterium]
MATVLVTGGTGDLGRSLVRKLIEDGDVPRILSRNASATVPAGAKLFPGDLANQTGIAEATDGADFVIHCASNPTKPAEDLEATWALLETAARQGVQRFIYISIVGVDRLSHPYYKVKRKIEQLVNDSSLSSATLRATQFHSFVAGLIHRLGPGPNNEILVPAGVRLQTIETGEVAHRLLEVTRSTQTGRAEDIGGPEILSLEEMVTDYLATRGLHATLRSVSADSIPGLPWYAWTGEAHLWPKHRYGRITWHEFNEREGAAVKSEK